MAEVVWLLASEEDTKPNSQWPILLKQDEDLEEAGIGERSSLFSVQCDYLGGKQVLLSLSPFVVALPLFSQIKQ